MYTLEEVKANIAQNVEGKIKALHTIDKHIYGFVGTNHVTDSVTQKNILDKPHLIPWAVGLGISFLEEDNRFEQLKGPTRDDLIMTAKFIHRDARDQAGGWGTLVHDNIEEWVREWMATGVRPGPIVDRLKEKGIEDYHVWGGVRSGEAVFDKYVCLPAATEILVGKDGKDHAEGAGTLDMLVWVPSPEYREDQHGDQIRVGHLELWDWKTSNQVDDFYAMQVAAYRRYFQHMTGLKIKFVKIFKLDKESDRFKCYDVPRPNEAAAAFRAISRVYDWRENGRKKLIEHKNRTKI